MVQLVETTLHLRCGTDTRRGLPPTALGSFYEWLPNATQHAVDVALRGASGKRGRKPSWWAETTQVRVLDQSSRDGVTSIIFGAPRLGEAAKDLFGQRMIDGLEDHDWRPSPEATSIDLVASALADVLADRQDSDRLDSGVLETFEHLSHFIGDKDKFAELVIPVHPGTDKLNPNRPDVHCDITGPTRARSWRQKTPQPRSSRIAGRLTMVDERTSRFALDLDDGRRVYGLYLPEDCKPLWNLAHRGERVTMLGKVVYRPNGQALRLDAEAVDADPEAPSFFSRVPEPERSWREQQRQQNAAGKGSIEGLFGVLAPGPGENDDEEAFIREVEAVS